MNKFVASMLVLMVLSMSFAFALDARKLDTSLTKTDIRALDADVDLARDRVPATHEATAALIDIPNRFLLWTYDGLDVMWGTYGNGYFRGESNDNEKVWGIYGAKIFAGFYGDQFFYGKYRGTKWKAFGLFDRKLSHGDFRLFPAPQPEPEPTCRESDNGVDPYKKGRVASCIQTERGNVCEYARDYCTSDKEVVVETYCKDDGTIGREKIECEYGCRNGACKKPRVCTDEYAPVCGAVRVNDRLTNAADIALTQKTFSNKCELVKANAKFLYVGECKEPTVADAAAVDSTQLV